MEKLRAVLTARSPALSAKLSTGNTMTVGMGSAVGKGTVYTPHITDDGILSWTNDGNRDNPAPTNIKGPKGDTGPQGLTINGTALNTANITITDDTKLSKTDASTLYLTKADASTTYLGVSGKAATAGAADTAAKLATARTINGVSFDGSANITIHATDSTARIASSLIGAANGVAPPG